jgi:hypothetical protein
MHIVSVMQHLSTAYGHNGYALNMQGEVEGEIEDNDVERMV